MFGAQSRALPTAGSSCRGRAHVVVFRVSMLIDIEVPPEGRVAVDAGQDPDAIGPIRDEHIGSPA